MGEHAVGQCPALGIAVVIRFLDRVGNAGPAFLELLRGPVGPGPHGYHPRRIDEDAAATHLHLDRTRPVGFLTREWPAGRIGTVAHLVCTAGQQQ